MQNINVLGEAANADEAMDLYRKLSYIGTAADMRAEACIDNDFDTAKSRVVDITASLE